MARKTKHSCFAIPTLHGAYLCQTHCSLELASNLTTLCGVTDVADVQPIDCHRPSKHTKLPAMLPTVPRSARSAVTRKLKCPINPAEVDATESGRALRAWVVRVLSHVQSKQGWRQHANRKPTNAINGLDHANYDTLQMVSYTHRNSLKGRPQWECVRSGDACNHHLDPPSY